jgi:hypothetical protein
VLGQDGIVSSPGTAIRARAAGALTGIAAAALLVVAVAFAREFRVAAVREFRFEWGTWAGAVLLAFAAGALVSASLATRVRPRTSAVALAFAGAVLIHLPAVLAGGSGWHRWPGFATTTFLDRTAPQLLAAAIAGGAATALLSRAGGGTRRRAGRAGERASARRLGTTPPPRG